MANISQIACNDLIVFFWHTIKVHKILIDGIAGGRCHARAHIHGIFESEVHYFSCCHSFDPHSAFFGADNNCSAASDRPACRKRALVAVIERKTKLLFCAGKMAGGECHYRFCKASCHKHGAESYGFSHGGASSIKAKEGYGKIH